MLPPLRCQPSRTLLLPTSHSSGQKLPVYHKWCKNWYCTILASNNLPEAPAGDHQDGGLPLLPDAIPAYAGTIADLETVQPVVPGYAPTRARRGKRPGPALRAVGADGCTSDRNLPFFIMERATGVRFLVDTGAEVSEVPATAQDRQHPVACQLRAVNNTVIPWHSSSVSARRWKARIVRSWAAERVTCPMLEDSALEYCAEMYSAQGNLCLFGTLFKNITWPKLPRTAEGIEQHF